MKETRYRRAPGSLIPHINVTPLIDVLLVLLIIFMTITPLRPNRFKTLVPQPPNPDDTTTLPHPDALVVSIKQDLTLQLNRLPEDVGSVHDTAKLSAALSAIFAQRAANNPAPLLGTAGSHSPRTVMIAAPRSIAYGDVAKVIDGIKGAGAAPIGLQIDNLKP